MSSRLTRAANAVAPLAAAVVACRYRPHARELVLDLSAPHQWIDAVGADTAVATLAGALLWLAAMWLCLGTSATVLSLGPGRLGRIADLIARHALPSALRRVVIAAAGASILAAPASAFAAGGSASPQGAAESAAAPAWPTDAAAESALALEWPTDSDSPGTGATTPRGASASDVAVRPGDSLWLIARRQLGSSATPAQTAAEWPRWYAANRATVGPDPNVLRPGSQLHAPVATHPTTKE